jgi:tRNA A-37 threonylcarbamoyl transferase component Bud32
VTLPAGTTLGPYEVVALIGAGGMAEVYRARDHRLKRDVAVKIIAPRHLRNPDALKRFQHEAETLAGLTHPNIVALFDTGEENGIFFVVSEILEGGTLRERLDGGPVPVRQAVELAIQVCQGLTAAHARGIVHRDLKPENLFVAKDGRHLKILDFGVAKLTGLDVPGLEPVPGASDALTAPGVLVGTLGYLSPEQARGLPVDARSDLFALGAVLYEMVTGKRAFLAGTGADTLAALLTREPPDMVAPTGPVPAPLEHVVRRCLNKDRDERFQSAHDLAFALEAVLATPTTGAGGLGIVGDESVAPRRPRVLRGGLAALGLVAAALAGFLAGRASWRPPAPTFKQLTFRRGWINLARFAPDGRTIAYTAAWDGLAPEIFTTRTDTRESRPLGITHAEVLSVSAKGQLAILLDPGKGLGLFSKGTLATVPIGGGTPREMLEDVREADWTPDGRELCVLRAGENGLRIELPAGALLYESPDDLRLLRVSPDGQHVAFVEGSEAHLRIVAVEVSTKVATVLASDLPANLFGLAWSPRGREVWFTAGSTTAQRDVLAVDLAGKRRYVYRSLATASLLDVSQDGRALLHRGSDRWGTRAGGPDAHGEKDYSIFDASVPASLSPDGQTLLQDEFSEAAGAGAVYVRRLPAGPAVRISDGLGWDLSRDGRSALVKRGNPPKVYGVPTGPGLERVLELGTVRPLWGKWVPPDSRRAVVAGTDRDGPLRLWLVDGASAPRPLGPASRSTNFAVSRDGSTVAARNALGEINLLPLDGGPGRVFHGIADDLAVGAWSSDGQGLFLVRTSVSVPCEVVRFDLRKERIDPWLRVSPSDATGVNRCEWMNLAADGRTYAYGYFQAAGDLFLAEGLN